MCENSNFDVKLNKTKTSKLRQEKFQFIYFSFEECEKDENMCRII